MNSFRPDDSPVIRNPRDFDSASGNRLERLIFNHRAAILVACAILTVLFGWNAAKVRLEASFDSTIPKSHPYIVNYLAHQADLAGLGNAVRIAVENRKGDIYDADYMATLRRINDTLYLMPGVDRPYLRSLWTPSTRWVSVTEEGLDAGPVIPERYDGSKAGLEALKTNVQRAGEVGQLVAFDQRSSIVHVPLLGHYADGRPLDYAEVSKQLESIRQQFESDDITIHITGFAKVVGNLIDGLRAVIGFFVVALLISAAVLYASTRCLRSTLLVTGCSLLAVVWQLGLLAALGRGLDPYSVMVPFLVFAIGMSHGAQKMNGIMQDIGRGTHRVVAARYTFRRLFVAGITALLCDAVGFAVLALIDIRAIRDLAWIASMGVAVLIFTNLILLPILLSYVGVNPKAAQRSLRAEQASETAGRKHIVWRTLDLFTQRRWAAVAIGVAAVLFAGGVETAHNLKIGDLDAGAPELRPDSRYNRDSAFIGSAYGASSDAFVVMVTTPDGQCADLATLEKTDRLEAELLELPGVEGAKSLTSLIRQLMIGLNEGSFKWYELPNSQRMLNTVTAGVPRGLYNDSCNLLTLTAYLSDHKSDTLARVAAHVEGFAARNDTPTLHFQLAAGSAGIEAATNDVVSRANREMLFWVYGAVVLLCWITFRSWRAVICTVLPLMLTSVLCEVLMVLLGIGVKVSTLPVIALGVGIGVDYGLYVMGVLIVQLRAGEKLGPAYFRSLLFTGRVVMLTGATLAVSVATWVFSPIKFQADMGVLLAFMFVVNMLGSLILLPALACFFFPGAVPRPSPARRLLAATPE